MNYLKFIFLVCVSIFFCKKAFSSEYLNIMYKGCSKWNDYQKNENIRFAEGEFSRMMMCKSYINGWLSAGRMDNIFNPDIRMSSVGCYKRHGDFIIGERAAVVSKLLVRYLDDNPKSFEKSLDENLWLTMEKAYPC